MALDILSVGTAVPEHVLTADDAVELVQRVCCTDEKQKRLARTLYRQTKIAERRSVLPHTEAYRWLPGGDRSTQPPEGEPTLDSTGSADAATATLAETSIVAGTSAGPSTGERLAWYEQYAPGLALAAARDALAKASLPADAITHLVTVSCTGFHAPGVDLAIINELGLKPTTQRTHVGFMGCHGAINGLRTANALASEPGAVVLMVAVELCSLHYCFGWDTNRILGNALFADGAGAILGVASETPSNQAVEFANDKQWRIAATGSYVMPETEDLMTWRIGDNGFEMTLSARLPEVVEQYVGDWLPAWLNEQGTSVDAIESWAIHPGGPKIVEAAGKALGLAHEQTQISRDILAAHGNMSSATVLFLLKRLQEEKAKGPCLMLAFGPGLVAEVTLLMPIVD